MFHLVCINLGFSYLKSQTTPSLSVSSISSINMSCCGNDCNGVQTKISAVILDLDGTLLNTEVLTKDIVKVFLAKYGKVVDWEKEDCRLGMMYNESVTSIIKDYELPLTPDEYSKQITPLYHQMWPKAKPLPGANRLIKHLHKKGIPFALASNSITKNIEAKISRQQGWKESFSAILGSDQVDHGKPAPDIFLEAAKRMGVDAASCLVIEDSLVGVMAAKAAGMKVVAVPSLQAHVDRYVIADLVLHSLLEFQPEHWGLPVFEDWMENALIIEPLYAKGQMCEGPFYADADDPNVLPDQISGVFFGWAKLDRHGVSKVVVSIEWQHDSCAMKRIIQMYMLTTPLHLAGRMACISGDYFIEFQQFLPLLKATGKELTTPHP
ncbi:hypothetical protein Sjap_000489 [Stephania japonica]|uniref:Riboflavin kinase n=1 Tax=Stephania japonica TaxID=461633 RepID=A0AAP0PSI7_9MAGN